MEINAGGTLSIKGPMGITLNSGTSSITADKITLTGTPASNQAVPKSYVDNKVSGYESWTFTTLSGTTITKKVCIHN